MPRKGNPVNWFEIPVKEMARAKRFYEGVFGYRLKVDRFEGMKMTFLPSDPKGFGSSGSLVESKGYRPAKNGTKVYFRVGDINGTLKKVQARGGRVLLPRTSIGQWGFIANFLDTEGNLVALHSMR